MDLEGKRALVTGATSGIGRATAEALGREGAIVLVSGRDEQRGREVVAAIVNDGGQAELLPGDLSSSDGVAKVIEQAGEVDVLINNAGVMACPFGRTADGFETQFGTNHLGHFLLTALLYPALRAGEHPRVVTLTSAGHSRADVDLEDPNFAHTEYTPWVAYGQAKTANALFARELARRAGPSGLMSFAVHPGGIVTDLGRHLNDDLLHEMADFARRRSAAANESGESADIHFKTLEAGAATQVWAATTSELADHNGAYLANCGLGVLGADPGVNGFMPYLLDDAHAAELWGLSERLVGQRFDP